MIDREKLEKPNFDAAIDLSRMRDVVIDERGVVSFHADAPEECEIHAQLFGGEVRDGIWHGDMDSAAIVEACYDDNPADVYQNCLVSPLTCKSMAAGRAGESSVPFHIMGTDSLSRLHTVYLTMKDMAEDDGQFAKDLGFDDVRHVLVSGGHATGLSFKNMDFSECPEIFDNISTVGSEFENCAILFTDGEARFERTDFKDCDIVGDIRGYAHDNVDGYTTYPENRDSGYLCTLDMCGLDGCTISGSLEHIWADTSHVCNSVLKDLQIRECDVMNVRIEDCTYSNLVVDNSCLACNEYTNVKPDDELGVGDSRIVNTALDYGMSINTDTTGIVLDKNDTDEFYSFDTVDEAKAFYAKRYDRNYGSDEMLDEQSAEYANVASCDSEADGQRTDDNDEYE